MFTPRVRFGVFISHFPFTKGILRIPLWEMREMPIGMGNETRRPLLRLLPQGRIREMREMGNAARTTELSGGCADEAMQVEKDMHGLPMGEVRMV